MWAFKVLDALRVPWLLERVSHLLARVSRKGCTITERPVRHYPRVAGQQTGANWRVVLRAFRELLRLRRRILGKT